MVSVACWLEELTSRGACEGVGHKGDLWPGSVLGMIFAVVIVVVVEDDNGGVKRDGRVRGRRNGLCGNELCGPGSVWGMVFGVVAVVIENDNGGIKGGGLGRGRNGGCCRN